MRRPSRSHSATHFFNLNPAGPRRSSLIVPCPVVPDCSGGSDPLTEPVTLIPHGGQNAGAERRPVGPTAPVNLVCRTTHPSRATRTDRQGRGCRGPTGTEPCHGREGVRAGPLHWMTFRPIRHGQGADLVGGGREPGRSGAGSEDDGLGRCCRPPRRPQHDHAVAVHDDPGHHVLEASVGLEPAGAPTELLGNAPRVGCGSAAIRARSSAISRVVKSRPQ